MRATNGTSTTGALAQINPATRLRPDFSQPLVTWAENQLILAEAEYRGGGTLAVNETSARNRVGAVRAAAGYNVTTSASGTALLADIIERSRAFWPVRNNGTESGGKRLRWPVGRLTRRACRVPHG